MEDQKGNNREEIFSKRIRAGKKRTYFVDVRETKKNDYYLTITESKRKFGKPNNFVKHKIFLYKEDFNKFLEGLQEAISYVKDELLPDYDFEKFDHSEEDEDSIDELASPKLEDYTFDEEEFNTSTGIEINTTQEDGSSEKTT